jgi:hypothetical protein
VLWLVQRKIMVLPLRRIWGAECKAAKMPRFLYPCKVKYNLYRAISSGCLFATMSLHRMLGST